MVNQKIIFRSLLGIIVIITGTIMMNVPVKDSLLLASVSQVNVGNPEIELAIAGATSSTETSGAGNSWPGELISLRSIQVQPTREGTIASWNVHIGQKVYAGQVLGTLSQPPAMPDTVVMLADEAKMLTMARINVDAKRAYTKERLAQLESLRANTERSRESSRTLLGVHTSENSGSANFSMLEAKRATVSAMLRGVIAKTSVMLSGNGTLPTRWTAITLKDAIGAQNSRLRDAYPAVLFAALTDLDTSDKLPIASGLAYFDLTIKLADSSIPDGGMLTDAELTDLKTMLHKDQEAFIMAVDKLRETELMAVDTEKMSFEQLRMIDNDIAMLKQELVMAEGDAAAKEASYRTVARATEGGSAIVAMKSGTVSSILKKPGEFVMPGTPVAVITGTKNDELFVRIRLPNNIQMPEIGAMFSVVRTGFPQDVHKAKLIGIGNAIDETGSVSADAILLEGTDWPVGVSLRVLVPERMNTILIKFSSLWWDVGGKPNVWVVSDAGRVYGKQLILGRTLGAEVEVYDGLVSGDHYVVKPVSGITEDMLIDDVETDVTVLEQNPDGKSIAPMNPHAGHSGMEGMEM